MGAAQYLINAIERRELLDRHVATLVEHWQRDHELIVDGLAGPNTIESLREATDAPLSGDLHSRALSIALRERGHGEDPAIGNNRGADVYRYREGDGTGITWDQSGPWCASFVSYCFLRAAMDLGVSLPFETSRGAKTLTERVAAAGRECAHPEVAAVICWHRSRLGAASRKGHVGLIVAYDLASDTLISVDGNKNRRGQRFATVEEFQHPRGRWRENLYMIATTAKRPRYAQALLRFPLSRSL